MRKLKVQFRHYTFQAIMTAFGVGTAGAIVFTLKTIITQII